MLYYVDDPLTPSAIQSQTISYKLFGLLAQAYY